MVFNMQSKNMSGRITDFRKRHRRQQRKNVISVDSLENPSDKESIDFTNKDIMVSTATDFDKKLAKSVIRFKQSKSPNLSGKNPNTFLLS